MSKDKNVIKKDTGKLVREFNYAKGDVKLNFSLRVDIKQHLKDFIEILENSLRDVKEELAKK